MGRDAALRLSGGGGGGGNWESALDKPAHDSIQGLSAFCVTAAVGVLAEPEQQEAGLLAR